MAQLVARLVRNEKVGGSNPPSSTTGRHRLWMSVFCMPGRVVVVPVVVLLVAPLVSLAPHVLSCGPGCSVCPWAAARPLAVSAASFARCVASLSGQAPPPPTGTAARPRRCPRAPLPGPAAAHRHRGRVLRSLRRPPAPRPVRSVHACSPDLRNRPRMRIGCCDMDRL